jgi:hypothetical protein
MVLASLLGFGLSEDRFQRTQWIDYRAQAESRRAILPSDHLTLTADGEAVWTNGTVISSMQLEPSWFRRGGTLVDRSDKVMKGVEVWVGSDVLVTTDASRKTLHIALKDPFREKGSMSFDFEINDVALNSVGHMFVSFLRPYRVLVYDLNQDQKPLLTEWMAGTETDFWGCCLKTGGSWVLWSNPNHHRVRVFRWTGLVYDPVQIMEHPQDALTALFGQYMAISEHFLMISHQTGIETYIRVGNKFRHHQTLGDIVASTHSNAPMTCNRRGVAIAQDAGTVTIYAFDGNNRRLILPQKVMGSAPVCWYREDQMLLLRDEWGVQVLCPTVRV